MDIPRNNLTALQHELHSGWVSNPSSRGTSSILYTCLVTILLCVYNAIHPNVPPSRTTVGSWLSKKIRYALSAILMPELVLMYGTREYTTVRWLCKKLATPSQQHSLSPLEADDQVIETVHIDDPKHIMSGTVNEVREKCKDHSLYAWLVVMGGIRVRLFSQEDRFVVLTPEVLVSLHEDGHEIKVDDASIQDRSKSNIFAKCLTLMQVLWMVVDCISRKAQGLPLTLLEIHTMIQVLCALAIYMIWFQKPQDIQEATVVTLPPKYDPVIAHITSQVAGSEEHEVEFYHCQAWRRGSITPRQMKDATPRRQVDTELASIDGRIKVSQGPAKSGLSPPNVQGLYFTPHEDRDEGLAATVFAKIVCKSCAQFVMIDLHLDDRTTKYVTGKHSFRRDDFNKAWFNANEEYNESVGMIISNRTGESETTRLIVEVVFLSIAMLITGSLHLTAWNYAFPSFAEQWLWRASAITVTLMPFLIVVCWLLDLRFMADMTQNIWVYLLVVDVSVRVVLIVQCFVSLRRLPIGVFAIASWSNYIPHI